MRLRRQMRSKQAGNGKPAKQSGNGKPANLGDSCKPAVEWTGAREYGSLVSEAEAAKVEALKYQQDPKSYLRMHADHGIHKTGERGE